MEQSKKGKRRKLHEISLEKDIRYRGPLSYRHFKIFGWLCILASQILVLISLAGRFTEGAELVPSTAVQILLPIASMSIPFLLLANFSQILDTSNGIIKQLRINGIVAGGIIVFSLVFYLRYIVGVAKAAVGTYADALSFIDNIFAKDFENGYPAFNLFIDLFLCTLFMFFLDHVPQRFFTGKKLRLFRALSALPVMYEVASLVLKYLAAENIILLPVVFIPFLTTKPPIMFVVFLILAVFIKNRERLFCKYGRSREEYKKFLATNTNSLHFSVFTAITLLIAGFADMLLYGALELAYIQHDFFQAKHIISSLNIGDSVVLVVIAPIVMLFSYTKKYKNGWVDILIPVLGVFFIVILYLEGAYNAVTMFISSLN